MSIEIKNPFTEDDDQTPEVETTEVSQDPLDQAIAKARAKKGKTADVNARTAELIKEKAEKKVKADGGGGGGGDAREQERRKKLEEIRIRKEEVDRTKPLTTQEAADAILKDLDLNADLVDGIGSEYIEETNEDVGALVVKAVETGGINRTIATVRSTAIAFKTGIIDKVSAMDETQLLAAYRSIDDVSTAGYIAQCAVAHQLFSVVRNRCMSVRIGERGATKNPDGAVEAALKKALLDNGIPISTMTLRHQAQIHATFFADDAQPSEESGIDKVSLLRLAMEKLPYSMIKLAAQTKGDRWQNLSKLVDLKVENPSATFALANATLAARSPRGSDKTVSGRFTGHSPVVIGLLVAISAADGYIKANKDKTAIVYQDPDTLEWTWHVGIPANITKGQQFISFSLNSNMEIMPEFGTRV